VRRYRGGLGSFGAARLAVVALSCVLLCLAAVTAGGQSGTEPEPEPEETDGGLSREATLRRDIETAGFQELIAWAERLELSTRGSAEELRSRLYEHYDVAPADGEDGEEADGDTEEDGRRVIIESASQTEYFTLEDIDENYVRLRGGVSLTLEDQERDTEHRISADEVVFNRSQNALTASGGVEYTIIREGSEEQFRGQSLTFFLDDWEGLFLRGTSTRTQTVEGEEIEFEYSGESITRSPDDTVVLEEGTITSSKADPPYYHIKANKLWIFGPGEWGMKNAVLHVGRVPVFYFPFFFRPGDRLFFHPSVGYRSRGGTYIQTTTYLLGQFEPEDSGVSFLQMGQSGTDVRRERDGLFMRPVEDPEEQGSDPGTLKALADVYSQLGAYLGLEGELSGLSFFDSLRFSSGVGVSRALYSSGDATGRFTPYRVESGVETVHWDSTNFLGMSLPLRYKLDTSLSISQNPFELSGTFQLYSDPYVDLDFAKRSEQMQWLELIRGEQEQLSSGASEQNSLEWELTGSYDPSLPSLTPYVSRTSIDRAEISLDWGSKSIPADELPDFVREADRNPAERFFYPDTLELPFVAASAGGTLLSLPSASRDRETDRNADEGDVSDDDDGTEDGGTSADGAQAKESGPVPGLRTPWGDGAANGAATGAANGAPGSGTDPEHEDEHGRLPQIQGTLGGLPEDASYGFDLGYSFGPELRVQHEADQDQWTVPEDVSFDFAYSTLTSSNRFRLDYEANYLERLVVFDGRLSTSAQYRDVYNAGDLTPERLESLELQAKRYNALTVNQDATLSSYPLQQSEIFGESRLSYTFNTLLFERTYEQSNGAGYVSNTFAWKEEYISSHRVSSTLAAQLFSAQQTLGLSATLPPLDRSYEGDLRLRTGPLSSTLSASVTEREDEWVYDPVTLTQSLTVSDAVSFNQRSAYDVEQERVDSLSVSLSAWALDGSYRMEQARGLEFDPNAGPGESPWKEQGSEALRPDRASVELGYAYESDPLWKNRITWGVDVDSALDMDLRRFTDSSLSFTLQTDLFVNEFLEFSFRSVSQNNLVYQYVPSLAEKVGREPRRPLPDLLRSFGFTNREAREESFFKLQSIQFDMVHHLGDWDLRVSYQGVPEIVNEFDPGEARYEWSPRLEVVVEWRPVPELATDITFEDDTITFEETIE
jgi:hypothetical protein